MNFTNEQLEAYLFGNKTLIDLHIESKLKVPYFAFCRDFNKQISKYTKPIKKPYTIEKINDEDCIIFQSKINNK